MLVGESKTSDPDMTPEKSMDLIYWICVGAVVIIGIVFIGVVIWRSESRSVSQQQDINLTTLTVK